MPPHLHHQLFASSSSCPLPQLPSSSILAPFFHGPLADSGEHQDCQVLWLGALLINGIRHTTPMRSGRSLRELHVVVPGMSCRPALRPARQQPCPLSFLLIRLANGETIQSQQLSLVTPHQVWLTACRIPSQLLPKRCTFSSLFSPPAN